MSNGTRQEEPCGTVLSTNGSRLLVTLSGDGDAVVRKRRPNGRLTTHRIRLKPDEMLMTTWVEVGPDEGEKIERYVHHRLEHACSISSVASSRELRGISASIKAVRNGHKTGSRFEIAMVTDRAMRNRDIKQVVCVTDITGIHPN